MTKAGSEGGNLCHQLGGNELDLNEVPVKELAAEAGRSPEVGSSRPACPTWRNPVSTKNTKLARGGSGSL
uniref:Uncharacterized protein n=1 Tax=Theropithecus gelada TaxID=9565 RepID=A0A8D2ER28_THEGE